jgi:superfamily II DNA/RNA helicase
MLGANSAPASLNDAGGAEPLAIVMAPTRELVMQIFHETRKFSYDTMIKSAVAYGGVSVNYQKSEIQRGVDIVIVTPGRLLDFLRKGVVSIYGGVI